MLEEDPGCRALRAAAALLISQLENTKSKMVLAALSTYLENGDVDWLNEETAVAEEESEDEAGPSKASAVASDIADKTGGVCRRR